MSALHPGELELAELPALLKRRHTMQAPNRYTGSHGETGISIDGTLTSSLASSMGEYLSAVTLPQRFTVAGLAKLLARQPLKILDITEAQIRPAANEKLDLEALPDFTSLESFRRGESFFGVEERDEVGEVYQLIAKMPNLRELRVNHGFDDEAMPPLQRLTKLVILDLSMSKVTDDGWKHLPDLPHLQHLSVPNGITHLELKNLPRLKYVETHHANLRSLWLENLPSFDTGIYGNRRLQRLTIRRVPLEMLHLYNSLQHLEIQDSPILRLNASRAPISDQRLKELVTPEIEVLSLANTEVTSASLDVLLGLKKLKILDVTDTQLTEADVIQLLKSLDLEHLTANHLEVTDVVFPELSRRELGTRMSNLAYRGPMPTWEQLLEASEKLKE